MEKIESLQNGRVKNWKKLATKKGREQSGTYLLDGWHLVKEAMAAQATVKTVMGTAAAWREYGDLMPRDLNALEISPEIAKTISDTVTPQGIFAEVAVPEAATALPDVVHGAWLFLDAVQDPGNIGTMVRTADAAGFAGVVFGRGTADQFAPKVVRAMQGSQFHIQLVTEDLYAALRYFKRSGLAVYGTKLDPTAVNFREVQSGADFGLIMGNEGNGMADQLGTLTKANLYIPILGQAESLNVAVAAGVLMFQLKQE
ncbi:TrmH family RNA methyltransferase [Furfurilactobacillus curtus]|uniref:23S rRNA methyltransferase n=1 Tax=Furfurilactobacillus curtus TaxID=1746200 RepID=A0ABQ5JKI3_9LACO